MTEFIVEVFLECFVSGMVVGREVAVLAKSLPFSFDFADGFQGKATLLESSQGRAHDGCVLGGCVAQFDGHVSVFLRFLKPSVGAIRCAGISPVDEAVEDFVVAVVDDCGVISAITEVIEYLFGSDFNSELPSFGEAVKAVWEFGGEEVAHLAVILDVFVVD